MFNYYSKIHLCEEAKKNFYLFIKTSNFKFLMIPLQVFLFYSNLSCILYFYFSYILLFLLIENIIFIYTIYKLFNKL